ncbi:MAG: NAD(P)-dependent oxidoreductase [SAR202 cluster bacterium]|nr:NAD(P)-dependent oxidoreductase [SAR202 cluster bacterium]|tara:strand:+ start:663 stop:1601 length:939 start_codon:yes stop_codon:yes gene_type:complete
MGSVLCRVLLREGHEVIGLDSLLQGSDSLTALYLDDNFTFVRGDIRSSEVLERVIPQAEAVVHLAAIVGDPACAREPDVTQAVNVDGTMDVIRACRANGIDRFVFASTCSNYGKMADPDSLVDEESELAPVSLYAESKVAVENHLLDTLSDDGPTVTLLRFATLFGISPRMRFDLTVNTLTMEMLTEGKTVLYGEQFWRPYIHVLDAARAIALVLQSPKEKVHGQVFNVGDTDQNYQKGQLADLVLNNIGGAATIEHVERDEDPRDYRVSFQKINRELGFQITRTAEDGVKEIIDAISQGVITDCNDPRYSN